MNRDSGRRRGPYKKVNDVPPRRKYEVHQFSSHHQSSSTSRKEVQEPKKNPPEPVVVKRDFITTDLSRRNALGTTSTSTDSTFKIPKLSESLLRNNNLNTGQKSEKRCTTFYSASFEMEMNRKRAAEREANFQGRKRPPQYSRYRYSEDSLPDRMREDSPPVYDHRRMEIKSTVGAVYDSKKSEFFSESMHKKPASEPKRKTEVHIRSSSEWKHYPINTYIKEHRITEDRDAAASRAKKAEVKISAYERKKMEAESAASKQNKTESKVSAYEKKKMETKAAAYEQKISAAKAAAYEKKKREEEARASAYEKKKREEEARAAAAYEKKKREQQAKAAAYEKKKREEEARAAAAYEKKKREQQAKAAAYEKKKREEEARASAYEKKKREEEARAAAAYEKKKREEQARAAAAYEKKKREEQARVAAFEKKKREEQARVAAFEKKKREEQARVAAFEKKKREEQARVAAFEKKKREQQAKAAAYEKKKMEEQAKAAAYEKKKMEEQASASRQKKAESKASASRQKKTEPKASASRQKKTESKASAYEQEETVSKAAAYEQKKVESRAFAYEQTQNESKTSYSERKKTEASKASAYEQRKTEIKSSTSEHKKHESKVSASEQKQSEAKTSLNEQKKAGARASTSSNVDVKVQEQKENPTKVMVVKPEFRTTDLSRRDVPGTSSNKSDSMSEMPKIQPIPTNTNLKIRKLSLKEYQEKHANKSSPANLEIQLHKNTTAEGMIKLSVRTISTDANAAIANEQKISVIKVAPNEQKTSDSKASASEQKITVVKAAPNAQDKTESKLSASEQPITEAEAPLIGQKVESEAKADEQNKTVAKATASGRKTKVSKASASGKKKKGAKTSAKGVKKTGAKTSASGHKKKGLKISAKVLKKTGTKTSASEKKKTDSKVSTSGQKKADVKTGSVGEVAKQVKSSAENVVEPENKEIKPVTQRKKPGPKPKRKTEAQIAAIERRRAKIAADKAAKALDLKFRPSKRVLLKRAFKPKRGPIAEVVEEHSVLKPSGSVLKKSTKESNNSAKSSSDKSAKLSSDKSAKSSSDNSAKSSSDKSAKSSSDKSAKSSSDNSAKSSSDKSAKLSSDKSTKLSSDKSAKSSSDNSAKSSSDKSAKLSSDKSAKLSSDKSAKSSSDKSARLSSDKSAKSSSDKSAKSSSDKSAKSSSDKSAKSSSDNSAKLSSDKSAKSSSDKSAKSSSDKSAKSSSDKSAKLSSDKSAKSSSDKSAKSSSDKSAKSSSDKSAKSSSDKSAKSSSDKSAKSSSDKSAKSSSDKSAKSSSDKSAKSSSDKSAKSFSGKSAKLSSNKSAKSSSNKTTRSSSNKSIYLPSVKITRSSSKKSANSSSNNITQQSSSNNTTQQSSSNKSTDSSSKKSEIDKTNETASATNTVTVYDDFVFKRPLCPPVKSVVKVSKPAVDSGKKAESNIKKGGIQKTKKKLEPIKFQYYAIQDVPKLKDIVISKLKEIAKKQQPSLTTTIEKIIKSSNKKADKAKKQSNKDKAKKRKPVNIEELKKFNDTFFCPIYPKKDLKYFNTYVKYINRRHEENVKEIKRLEKMRDKAGNDSVLIGVRHKVKKFNLDEAMTDDEDEDIKSRSKGKRRKRSRYDKSDTEEEAAKKAAAAKAKAARARRNKGRSRTKSSINKRRQAREASQKRWAKQRADKARVAEEEARAQRERDLDNVPLCIDKAQSMNKELERGFDDIDVDKFIVAPGSRQVESLLNRARKKYKNRSKALKSAIKDDGNPDCFRDRIAKYRRMRSEMDKESRRMDKKLEHVRLDGNNHDFYIPQKIWRLLFEYQREAVKWLFELHTNLIGGILGDEMGLGKSVSLIAFLVALSKTKTSGNCELYDKMGPVILICPATVMFQWVEEFHKWAPKFRVSVLHSSGSCKGRNKTRMIQETIRDRGVLITTYGSLASYQEYLLKHSWHYVILDEGHRIRNPEAQITNICKRFETCHRLLLTGTPMQNNLKEFWSLIDFVCPGKLGLLASFEKNIATPIRKACARDSTPLAKHVAYKCASLLHQIVGEFILRRTKEQVQDKLQLPPKTEQICLCRLTDVQRECYGKFVSASYPKFHKGEYIDRVSMFKFMIRARKICNHPYLYGPKSETETLYSKEFFEQSSKMVVLDKLLEHWQKNGHRVLVFSQGIKTLDLIEKFVQKKRYTYFRMDGATPIKDRQDMIKSFNEENEMFIFLLTTRVGGVGVTLTGADRVIIFDPDWNPCTDIQAKERCWRIGQQRDVMIYRLLTAGTIEERIYQRQKFKCFLSDQILNDLNHGKFLKMSHCKQLFSLNDCHETSIFHYDTKLKLSLKRKYDKISQDKKPLSESTKSLPKIPKLAKAESSNSGENVDSGKKIKTYGIDWAKIPIQLSKEKKAELLANAQKICNKFKKLKAENKVMKPLPLVKSKSSKKSSSDKPKSCLNYQIKGNPKTGLRIKLFAQNEVQSSNAKIEDCQIDYLVKTYDAEPIKKAESSKKAKFEKEFYLISKLPNVDVLIQSDEKGEETGKKGDSVCKMLIEKFEEDKLANNRIKLKPAETSTQLDAHFLARVNKKVKKFLTAFQTKSENKLAAVAGKWEENTDLATALIIYFHKQLALPGKSTLSTEEIIKEFRTKIRPDQTQLLRTMIKNLARRVAYSSCTEETTFWELKPEYKI